MNACAYIHLLPACSREEYILGKPLLPTRLSERRGRRPCHRADVLGWIDADVHPGFAPATAANAAAAPAIASAPPASPAERAERAERAAARVFQVAGIQSMLECGSPLHVRPLARSSTAA